MAVDASEIIDLLESFDPDDDQQRSYRRRMLELASGVGKPTDRYHYEPGHFTASGFVSAPTHSAVLLIHHAKIGKWLQPGGHIEPTDGSVEAAARREVAEETGLADLRSLGLVDLDIHRFPARGGDPDHLHFDIRYGFESPSGIVGKGDGTLDVRWVLFDDVSRWNPELSISRPVAALAEIVGR